MEINSVSCSCREKHRYLPSILLKSVKNNAWIRDGDSHRRANVKNLAEIVQKSGTSLADQKIIKLLEAIGISHIELEMQKATGGNEEKRSGVLKIISSISDAPDSGQLIEKFNKISEESKKARSNQELGRRVEEAVKENLKKEGFNVTRTGEGSDFQIELENGDMRQFEIAGKNQKWLVEVKSTIDNKVKMTERQAETAVNKKEKFILCVVKSHNIEDLKESENLPEEIKTKIRFVKNIGCLIKSSYDEFKKVKQACKDARQSEDNGVKLVLENTTRFQISQTIWDKDGFGIEKLAENLAHNRALLNSAL